MLLKVYQIKTLSFVDLRFGIAIQGKSRQHSKDMKKVLTIVVSLWMTKE